MTRKLQFILTALLLTVGVSSAWADNAIIYPQTQMGCRIVTDTSVEPSSWKYQSDATKLATITAETHESTYRKSGYFILEEWDFTGIDMDRIKSITITYTTKESQGARIWIYGSALPANTTTAAALAETMNTVMGAYPGADAASTMEGKSLANGGSRTTVTTNVVTQDVSITGSALTTLKSSISDNKIVFVSSTTANATLNFYTFKSDDYKPKMVIEYYPVTVTIGSTTTNYAEINSTLNSSFTASGKEADATVKIYDDVNMSNRIQVAANHTVNVVPQKAVTITNTASNSLSFLSNTASGVLNVGNSDYAITVKYSNSTTGSVVESANSTAVVNIENVVFDGITTSSTQGVIKACNTGIQSSTGTVSLKNVTFKDCVSTTEQTKNIVYCGKNDCIILEGNNKFTNCTGYDIYAPYRFKVSNNGVTNTTSIKVYATISPVATNVAEVEIPLFKLMVEGKYLQKKTGNTRNDMQVAEDVTTSYNLTVTAAGAATLVLPYTTTIPSGAKCYTLSYTSGNDITATEITGTLPAHTPVLVIADANTYTFTKTTAVTPSSNDNLLMGLYTTLTVPQTTGDHTNYVLQKQGGNVGFYKIGESGKSLAANRTYMSVKYVAGSSSAPAFFNIGFGGITGISDIEMKQNVMEDENAPIYNLNGVRMNSQNLPKGIYVKNGRKFVVK